MTPDTAKCPIRLPRPDEAGTPFADLLAQHVGTVRARRRVTALLQEWDTLRDELGEEPTIRAYAKRWDLKEAAAREHIAEFRDIFGAEPGEVATLLWNALQQQQHEHGNVLVPLLRVRVVKR